MENQISYSKKLQRFIRILASISIFILLLSNTRKIFLYGFETLFSLSMEAYAFIINNISLILFVFVIIFPKKLGLLSFVTFLYSSLILIFAPENNIGTLVYGLSIITLYARGMLNRQKKIKELIIIIIFFSFVLSELRFGKELFFKYLIEKTAYTFIFLLIMFFSNFYIFDMLDIQNSKHILDLQKYPELCKRDAEWLKNLLEGDKYEKVAIDYKMSLGSVKNRFKEIFDILGVGDKKGFLNKYSDFKICYGDTFSYKRSVKKR
ncbi:MAG: hypothetical protein K6D95_08300 [Treponema sp.]|nr:hypothetical protein [Treponema sp.]